MESENIISLQLSFQNNDVLNWSRKGAKFNLHHLQKISARFKMASAISEIGHNNQFLWTFNRFRCLMKRNCLDIFRKRAGLKFPVNISKISEYLFFRICFRRYSLLTMLLGLTTFDLFHICFLNQLCSICFIVTY